MKQKLQTVDAKTEVLHNFWEKLTGQLYSQAKGDKFALSLVKKFILV